MVISRSTRSTGLVTKSKAPRFIAVRILAMSPYAETMIARACDCRWRNSASSVSPSITGMLMSSSRSSMSGLLGEHCQRFLAVMGETELVFGGADLAAKALPEQQLEIGLVVDCEDLGRSAHDRCVRLSRRAAAAAVF
jgi:hypothetical protein